MFRRVLVNYAEVYMNKSIQWVILTSLFLSITAQAQVKTGLLEALIDSQEDIKSSNIDPNFNIKENKGQSESMVTNKTCSSDMQRSLPLRFVLSLLRGKGAKLVPSHDPKTGKLNIFGGPMIGNCNSMLDYVLTEPTEEMPYSFEVKIKGCGNDECPYDVQTINNDKVSDLKGEKFKPNMEGFISCLEKTGVLKDNKINKEKIVVSEFDVDKAGVNKTNKLVFASKGPAALHMNGAVYSKKNLFKNNECYYYEDIQKDGYAIYSKETIEENNLLAQAAKLCNEANYEEIYNNLDNFKNISSTYYNLEDIMKKDLLKEVAKAKKEFDKAVKDGDLSKIDTEKYAELMDNFYKLIVQKHFDDSNHNSADEENPNLLVNLYEAYDDAESKEEKAQIEKKIRDLVKDMNQYMEEPYFTADDYKYFISMKRKAPIKDPKWKQATLNLQKSLVSLRSACQAYAVDNSGCRFDNSIKDMMELEDLNDKIETYASKAETQYSKKEKVLKDPGTNNSEFYASKIRECKELYSKSNQKQMAWRQYQGQYQQQAVMYCQQKNQYVGMLGQMGGYYTKKYQQCIQGKIAEAKAQFTTSPTQIKLCDSMIDRYQDQYEEWANLESQRDEYYGSNSDDDLPSVAEGGFSYDVSQNPLAQAQPWQNQQANQYLNPQAYQMQMMQRQGQYMNSGFPQMNGNNYSMMGMNYGLNYGLNMGMNSRFPAYNSQNQMGMMNYYQNPAVSYMNPMQGNMGMGMNYGMGMSQGMPGAMMNYMGNSTMPGGNYSFTYGM